MADIPVDGTDRIMSGKESMPNRPKREGSPAQNRAGLRSFYADLHIHIGRTGKGNAVKISGSKDLTFANIAHEASERKGIELIGIIDCHAPSVQDDIIRCLDNGEMHELQDGGIRYRDTTILLGSEIEVRDPGMGEAHVLVYFAKLETMREFTLWISQHMKNVELSSQRIYVPARRLQEEVAARGGLFIPAHIFTPHKGIYGSASTRMGDLLHPDLIAGAELGLSADSEMAGYISELDPYPLLTNSDAHSLGKIGREYNELLLREPTFAEFRLALAGSEGRRIAANYGLNPRLGKYHRSSCIQCDSIIDEREHAHVRCPYCGSAKLVHGVLDRILYIADRETPRVPAHRPPYRYQVPLDFIPGLGKSKLNALLARFGTEMNILHRAERSEISGIVGEQIAEHIIQARNGTLGISSGGGGSYGKVLRS